MTPRPNDATSYKKCVILMIKTSWLKRFDIKIYEILIIIPVLD